MREYASVTSRQTMRSGWTRYGVQVNNLYFRLFAKGDVLAAPKGRTGLKEVARGEWNAVTVADYARVSL